MRAFKLEELAEETRSQLIGDPKHLIRRVNDIENATMDEATFLANSRYRHALKKTKAGVIFIDPHTERVEGKNYLISDHPSKAFQWLVDALFPKNETPSGFSGIHPTAVIHPTAKIGESVTIGPYAVIDEKVIIGDFTFIGAGCTIGPYTKVGESCLFYPRVVIRENCIVGNRVIIQPGAVIGSCGFGYITDPSGKHVKLNQVGNVILEDDVEIGANTTIDRSRFGHTIVGVGSKIDNLVQLGHGVQVGPHNIIVAQTGIAGSTTTGSHVVLGGQSALNGHINLASGTKVAGKSGVTKSLPKGEYGGIPARPLAEYNRMSVYLSKIETYVKEIKELDKRLKKLE